MSEGYFGYVWGVVGRGWYDFHSLVCPERERIVLKEIVHQRRVGLCPSQISISIKILGYEDIEENSGCRYQMEQSRGQKLHQNLPLRTRGRH